jgi:hypothetical protein
MNSGSGLLHLNVLLIAIASFILASTTAMGEVNVSVTGTNLTTGGTDLSAAASGDAVQIDILISNPDSAVAGATLTAFGVDFDFDSEEPAQNRLDFTGGSSAASSLALPRTLSNADIQAGVIRFFSGLSPTTPATGDASVDLGIKDGTNAPFVSPNVDLTGNGASHARLFFTVVGAGGELRVGDDGLIGGLTDANAPGSVGTINNATIQVPEPGAIAAGLAAMGSVVGVVGLRRRTD